jgi:hypothetical protein
MGDLKRSVTNGSNLEAKIHPSCADLPERATDERSKDFLKFTG